MPLPIPYRPNPYQSLADEQIRNVVASEQLRPNQGFNPRGAVGQPGLVARGALTAADIPAGVDTVRNGSRAIGWKAAAQARESYASQTLSLNGLGRPSGATARALRVNRLPMAALLPSDDLNQGPAHYRGLGASTPAASFSDRIKSVDVKGSCAQAPLSKEDALAIAGFIGSLEAVADQNVALDRAAEVFGDLPVACAFGLLKLETGALCKGRTAGMEYLACWVARNSGATDEELDRALAAGKRMASMSAWKKDSWRWRWWLLSGNTSWYKNPLVLGAGAVTGLLVWRFAKKRK